MEGKAMRASDWIDAEARPQEDGDFLVLDDRHGMLVAVYDTFCDDWTSYEHGHLDYVRYWQFIELPKEF